MLTPIEIESGVPNVCPGCKSNDYTFTVRGVGRRETENVCECGAVIGGQAGRTEAEVWRSYGWVKRRGKMVPLPGAVV